MTIGLLGKKLGMTRVSDETGAVIPVTVVELGPCPILQVKNQEKDGYTAVQLGFDERSERNLTKPMAGHFKRAGVNPMRVVREFRTDDLEGFEVGASLDCSIFEQGEKVDVTGVSKGRGFAGPMKKHGSSRGPESHGSRYHRRAGSIGASADPSRVFKGKPMPGHMGNARTTVQNIEVIRLDPAQNLLVLRGSVPGHNNGYIMIRKSVKSARKAARAAAKK